LFLFLLKEFCQHLKQVIDSKGSAAMVFAINESYKVVDMQKWSDKTIMGKGLKVPMLLIFLYSLVKDLYTFSQQKQKKVTEKEKVKKTFQ